MATSFITAEDRKSEAFQRFRDTVNASLAEARERLEAIGTDHDQTLIQRGRILALKELLSREGETAQAPRRSARPVAASGPAVEDDDGFD